MSSAIYGFATLASLAAAALGVHGLLGGTWTLAVPWLLPLGGLELTMDRLAGLFVTVVALTALPVSLYAIEYDRGARRGLGAYLAFLGAMVVVPLAANAVTFLVVWELMSLASWLLVARERDASRAAWVYAVMTHAGFACLLVGMMLLGTGTGSLAFADWRAVAPALDPTSRNVIFVLLGLGFAGKAGVIPLHVWLPLAHPAASSHVSALMSGVMVKLGIYGLLRISLDWLGVGPPWWGVVILVVGTFSAVIGVLYALVDHDLKRLLAFHTIENIGIILIGLGAALVFQPVGARELAALALVAALYHTVNHAAFKALLFLGAGSVLHATGTRNMEEMGGLVKRMPWTAACFLVGAIAIAGLPPLNGFVSEWLTFQALLQNLSVARPALNLVFALALAGLALTAGLAAACFVKAFGISFLALPRSEAAARAHESPAAMRTAMVALALACAGLGIGATLVVPVLAAVAAELTHSVPVPITVFGGVTVRVSGDFASVSTLTVAAALAAALLLLVAGVRLAGASGRPRVAETWGCGRILQTARMEYTATAFSSPFKRIFDFFYRPRKRLDIDLHPDSRFFVRSIAYESPTRSVFDDWLYTPLMTALRRTTGTARALQSGSANLYLAYILAALVAMLVFG
jgi:hydrogenase-4 component B